MKNNKNMVNKQAAKKFEPKDIRQILVSMIKSDEGQKIINDLADQIPELQALKLRGK